MTVDKTNYQLNLTAEQKHTYLIRRQEDAVNLNSALAVRDTTRIQDIAHRVKGSARLFDYIELEILAKQIENSSVTQNFEGLSYHIAEFSKMVNAALGESLKEKQ